ncbi:MAG: site-2 protease family protein [Saprospiraceae bacterium]
MTNYFLTLCHLSTKQTMSKTTKKLGKITSFLIVFAIALFFGYMLGKLLKGDSSVESNVGINTWLVILAIFPIVFFVLGIHEAGHALAGKMVGFELIKFAVGPLSMDKTEGIWKFHFNKSIETYGGLVISFPKGDQNLGPRFMKYVLGGPIASLLLAFLALLFYFLIPSLAVYFIIIGIMSLLIFIVTIIPAKAGSFYTDGARFFRIFKGGKVGQYEVSFLKIMANTLQGVRPRELVGLPELLDLGIELNEPYVVYLYGIMHQHAWDKNEIEDAEMYLEKYLEGTAAAPAMIANSAILDAAFFHAYEKKDLEKSNAYFQKFVMQPFISQTQVLATEASIHFIKGELELAKEKATAAKAGMEYILDKGMAVIYGEKIDKLLKTLSNN